MRAWSLSAFSEICENGIRVQVDKQGQWQRIRGQGCTGAKYERINATKRKSDEKRIVARMKANRAAEHVAWMKGYRQANKGKRLVLGK